MRQRIASLALAVFLKWSCGKPEPVDTPKHQPPDQPFVNAKSRDCDFNPAEAKHKGLRGRVSVRILIHDRGVVEQACAVDGPAPLRESAETAAKPWYFRPHLLNGKPWGRFIEENLDFQFVIDR